MSKKGFTLAELLIVVAIIGVLTAIAIPVFSSQLEKSREATDIANLRSAKAAAVAKYLADDLTDGTFYFDAQKGTLIAEADFTDGDILGYGKGTDKTGNAANTFSTEAVADGAIAMSWVDTDGASNENTANYAANSVVTDQIIKIVFDSSAAGTPGAPVVPNPGGGGSTPIVSTGSATFGRYLTNPGCHANAYDHDYNPGGCFTYQDDTLTWAELQLAENGTKYGYNANLITDTKIGAYAFQGCGLKEIQVADTVTELEGNALAACAVEKIVIPDTVTSIGDAVFGDSYDITEVSLPAGATYGSDLFVDYESENIGGVVINFSGTQAEWNAIEAQIMNLGPVSYTVNCTDGTLNK